LENPSNIGTASGDHIIKALQSIDSKIDSLPSLVLYQLACDNELHLLKRKLYSAIFQAQMQSQNRFSSYTTTSKPDDVSREDAILKIHDIRQKGPLCGLEKFCQKSPPDWLLLYNEIKKIHSAYLEQDQARVQTDNTSRSNAAYLEQDNTSRSNAAYLEQDKTRYQTDNTSRSNATMQTSYITAGKTSTQIKNEPRVYVFADDDSAYAAKDLFPQDSYTVLKLKKDSDSQLSFILVTVVSRNSLPDFTERIKNVPKWTPKVCVIFIKSKNAAMDVAAVQQHLKQMYESIKEFKSIEVEYTPGLENKVKVDVSVASKIKEMVKESW